MPYINNMVYGFDFYACYDKILFIRSHHNLWVFLYIFNAASWLYIQFNFYKSYIVIAHVDD